MIIEHLWRRREHQHIRQHAAAPCNGDRRVSDIITLSSQEGNKDKHLSWANRTQKFTVNVEESLRVTDQKTHQFDWRPSDGRQRQRAGDHELQDSRDTCWLSSVAPPQSADRHHSVICYMCEWVKLTYCDSEAERSVEQQNRRVGSGRTEQDTQHADEDLNNLKHTHLLSGFIMTAVEEILRSFSTSSSRKEKKSLTFQVLKTRR